MTKTPRTVSDTEHQVIRCSYRYPDGHRCPTVIGELRGYWFYKRHGGGVNRHEVETLASGITVLRCPKGHATVIELRTPDSVIAEFMTAMT